MAAGKRPEPEGSSSAVVNIEDGTMCRAQSPLPGPLGVGAHERDVVRDGPYAHLGDAEHACAVFSRAVLLSSVAVNRETGYKLGDIIKDAIPDLITMLAASDPNAPSGTLVTTMSVSTTGV